MATDGAITIVAVAACVVAGSMRLVTLPRGVGRSPYAGGTMQDAECDNLREFKFHAVG